MVFFIQQTAHELSRGVDVRYVQSRSHNFHWVLVLIKKFQNLFLQKSVTNIGEYTTNTTDTLSTFG